MLNASNRQGWGWDNALAFVGLKGMDRFESGSAQKSSNRQNDFPLPIHVATDLWGHLELASLAFVIR